MSMRSIPSVALLKPFIWRRKLKYLAAKVEVKCGGDPFESLTSQIF